MPSRKQRDILVDDGERRPEFVRHVVDEAVGRLIQPFEPPVLLRQDPLARLQLFQQPPHRLAFLSLNRVTDRTVEHFRGDVVLDQIVLGPVVQGLECRLVAGQSRQHDDRQVGRLIAAAGRCPNLGRPAAKDRTARRPRPRGDGVESCRERRGDKRSRRLPGLCPRPFLEQTHVVGVVFD